MMFIKIFMPKSECPMSNHTMVVRCKVLLASIEFQRVPKVQYNILLKP